MIARNPPTTRPLISECAFTMDETTTSTKESTQMCLNRFEEAMVNILECRLCNDASKANALRRAISRRTPISSLHVRFSDPAEALNYSLQQLASALRARIVRKEAMARNDPRELELMTVLGSSRYGEAKCLVRRIKMLQLSRGASACTGWGPCSTQRSLPTVIPSPASQLFFYTQLPRVMESTPPGSFADQDWETLMNQAKDDIREYMEWTDRFELQKTTPVQKQEKFSPSSVQSKRVLEPASVLIEDDDDATTLSLHSLPHEPIAKRRRL